MPTLAQCIEKYHEALARRNTLLSSGKAAAGTGADSPLSGEAKNLVLSSAAVNPGQFTGHRHTETARCRQAASRLGMSYRSYRRHILAGQKWCSGHRAWRPAGAFSPTRGNTVCRSCRNAANRQRYRAVWGAS